MNSKPINRLASQLEERRSARVVEIHRLAQQGLSNAEIARRVGLTRQRVQQIRARRDGRDGR
jgi:DNA-binding NarL/FixJ family response regulator